MRTTQEILCQELSKARLRLALRLLSGAAGANPQIFARNEWMAGMRCIAKLLGEKADLPFEVKTQPTELVREVATS